MQVQSPKSRSKAPGCIYVWDECKKEMITYQLPIDPLSMDFRGKAKGRSISKTNSEATRVEETLKYFHNLKGIVENPSRVRQYLYRYPDIAKLARFVSDEVYQYFDFRAQLSLEVQDEGVPDSEYLTIYVRVPEYDDSVMDRIREIRECYYDSLSEMTGWFILTTDFSPPR